MVTTSIGLKTYIWNNNIKSIILLLAFPILVYFLVWLLFAVFGFFSINSPQLIPEHLIIANDAGLRAIKDYWHIVLVAVGGWFIFAFFSHQAIINKTTGAKPVTRQEAPEIYNLLENLCISRGLAMPKLCIIEHPALNAFASGINDKTYTITLTRGLIDTLDRQELESVIAHELTHIMNRDVRLLIVCAVFVGIFSFLSEFIFRSLRYGRLSFRGRGRGNGLPILIAWLVLMLGYMLAVILRFAISRKREYLADAGAVELTKNPHGMINALQKISGNAKIEGMPEEVSQMFIENPPGFFGIFATHPPIEDRIEAIKFIGGIASEDIKQKIKAEPNKISKKQPRDNNVW